MRSTNKQIPAKGPFPESIFYLAQINKNQGRIQDFKSEGAGVHLKKLRRAAGGRRESFGVFRVKNQDYTTTNYFFSNFRRGAPLKAI